MDNKKILEELEIKFNESINDTNGNIQKIEKEKRRFYCNCTKNICKNKK